MVTFEGFLSEVAYLGKKSSAALSAKILNCTLKHYFPN